MRDMMPRYAIGDFMPDDISKYPPPIAHGPLHISGRAAAGALSGTTYDAGECLVSSYDSASEGRFSAATTKVLGVVVAHALFTCSICSALSPTKPSVWNQEFLEIDRQDFPRICQYLLTWMSCYW